MFTAVLVTIAKKGNNSNDEWINIYTMKYYSATKGMKY